jgi:hypothetical protein
MRVDGREPAMTAVRPDADDDAITQRFCGECGHPIGPGTVFCGECGSAQRTAAPPAEPRSAKATPTVIEPAYAHRPPLTPPVTPTPHGGTPMGPPMNGAPIPPPMPVHPYAYPQPAYPAPEPAGRNTGLLVGLVLAAVLALGAIVAVVLVASGGGGGQGVTLSNASAGSAAPSAPGGNASGAGSAQGSSAGAGVPAQGSAAVSPALAHTAPAATASAAATPSAAAGSPAAAVQQHWQLIGQGNYEAAFALFTPSYQAQLGHDTWVGDKRQDQPTVSGLVVGTPQITSSNTATVQLVSLHTVGRETPNCHNWTGSYDLTKSIGSWLINQANLASTTC